MTTLEPNRTTASLAGKYLTFVLNRESYGMPVLKAREIIRPSSITAVPRVPAHVLGVINLRGRIIPVIDLCSLLGCPHAASTENTCIVVVQVNGVGNLGVQFGLLVDAVEEVTHFAADQIEPAPEFGAALNTACILGMAKTKEAVLTLLDIDQILGSTTVPVPATLD
jgi:purine-binding chemotaxis protein CheW